MYVLLVQILIIRALLRLSPPLLDSVKNSFFALKMQQKLSLLKVRDLITSNEMVAELQKVQLMVSFCSPMIIRNVMVSIVTDASHCGNNETYGQTRLVSVLKIDLENDSVFHGICWSSVKQQKIVTLRSAQKYSLPQTVMIAATLLRLRC